MKRTYKRIFADLIYDLAYTEEIPWNALMIDGDSLAFKYIREFASTDIIETQKHILTGLNAYDPLYLENYLTDICSDYSFIQLSNLINNLDNNNITYRICFGSNSSIPEKSTRIKEYQMARNETIQSLTMNKRITSNSAEVISTLSATLLMNSRDRVRDKLRVKIEQIVGEEYLDIDDEPDIFCANWSDKGIGAVITEDYDIFLFGGKDIIRNINNNKMYFLNIHKVMRTLGYENVEQLINAAVLCGTDYNEGVPGIGPVKAYTIVANNIDDPIIDKNMVSFFTDKHVRTNSP